MKKFLQTFALIYALQSAVVTVSSAQTILGITMIPANPTNNDSITFMADCRFPSGNCDPFIMNLSSSGNYFYASALHCLGVLSFICAYIDTFIMPPQVTGSYYFIFHLDAGFGPNCTPGIVAGPTDTIAFIVSSATGINEAGGLSRFNISPNPSNGTFKVRVDNFFKNKLLEELEVFNLSGMKIANYFLSDPISQLKIDLPLGIYLCRMKNNPAAIQKLVIVN